jgi:hypothetical protein
MDDIGRNDKTRTTEDETLFPEFKEDHENHPHATGKDSRDTTKKRGHTQSLWQRFRAGTIHNQITVIFTGLIFAATALYAGFSGWQLVVMKKQLREIQNSSTDTHTLASAADTQSKQAIQQTDKMEKSLAKTDNLIRATSNLAKESKRYADDADRSLALARQNFTIDQRPYIWFEAGGPVIESGKKIAWGLRFKNYGRSPAVHVRSCVLLFWGMAPLQDLSSQLIADKCEHLEGLKPTVIIPPGADVYSTALSGDPVNEDLASMLKGRDFALVMIGRSTYRDNAGNSYSSMTCMGRVATGAVMACDKFIEIK